MDSKKQNQSIDISKATVSKCTATEFKGPSNYEDYGYQSDLYQIGLIHYDLRSGYNLKIMQANNFLRISDSTKLSQSNFKVSNEELQVIKGCTQKDKNKRMTIIEVLESDFFTGRNKDLKVNRVKQFMVRNKGMMVYEPVPFKRTSKNGFTGITNFGSDSSKD